MQDYKISSYVGVGPLAFNMSRSQAHAVLGPPLSTKKSRFADELKDFWEENGLQLTFTGPDETLVEIGLYPNLLDVEFNGIKLFNDPGPDVMTTLLAIDDQAFETVGVTIFPKLGLTATGFLHPDDADKSVTAFAAGRWDEEIAKHS